MAKASIRSICARRPGRLGLALLLAALAPGSAFAAGSPITTILDLGSIGTSFGEGLIFAKPGVLYGTSGGADGAVFEVTLAAVPAKSTGKLLYSFSGGVGNGDGDEPNYGLALDKSGIIFGTTTFGGAAENVGTIFMITPTRTTPWHEVILHRFKGRLDGAEPAAGMIFDAAEKNLYGTTQFGGVGCSGGGCGTVFKFARPGGAIKAWTKTVIYYFKGGRDGEQPVAPLAIDAKGNIYGTTLGGGDPACFSSQSAGCGTVFRLTPKGKGWTEQVLYCFKGHKDGSVPYAGVTFGPRGVLYGTTYGDQEQKGNNGTVFRLTPAAGATPCAEYREDVLYDFKGGADAAMPLAGVTIGPGGALFGSASRGGIIKGNGDIEAGALYKLTPAAKAPWTETVLYRFKGSGDSGTPQATLIGTKTGHFYSTTAGGSHVTPSDGTVFELVP